MPSRLKVRVKEARNLPIMDRTSELTDAYVEIKFNDEVRKTDIDRKTLNPKWEQQFRFEVPDDSDLQDAPVELKVMDYDIVSSDDVIGCVYIDLNGLLMGNLSQLEGWFPIYDTLHGVRGELSVLVKLEFFGDVNPFKDSSAGIQFFGICTPPECYTFRHIIGFVEELIVEPDPEYHWKDTIRTNRASNETRQTLLYKLSGRLRRQIGVKVQEMNGNAVLGYRECVDFEGDYGIVARGYGTACLVDKIDQEDMQRLSTKDTRDSVSPPGSPFPSADPQTLGVHWQPNSPSAAMNIGSPSRDTPPEAQGPLTRIVPKRGKRRRKEVELLTLTQLPSDTQIRIGGSVTARSVKLLTGGRHQKDARDQWWTEIREEMRSHARRLGCQWVLGYREVASLFEDDFVILSAYGTACDIRMSPTSRRRIFDPPPKTPDTAGLAAATRPEDVPPFTSPLKAALPNPLDRASGGGGGGSASGGIGLDSLGGPTKAGHRVGSDACTPCHVPYNSQSSPFPMKIVPCRVCKRKYVPEILLATIEPPPGIGILRPGVQLEIRVCRAKKDPKGDAAHATVVSEAIPFLEYDMHRQFLHKMKLHGMNAIFGLRWQLSVGEEVMIGIATGTAMYLKALPPPPVLQIKRDIASSGDTDDHLSSLQRHVETLSEYNASQNQKLLAELKDDDSSSSSSDSEGSSYSSDSSSSLSSGAGADDGVTTFCVEVDDRHDADLLAALLEPAVPEGVTLSSLDRVHGTNEPPVMSNLQLITVVRRVHWSVPNVRPNYSFATLFHLIYADLAFRLQYFNPCALLNIRTQVQLPAEDSVQIALTAMAVLQQPDPVSPLLLPSAIEQQDGTTLAPSPASLAAARAPTSFATNGSVLHPQGTTSPAVSNAAGPSSASLAAPAASLAPPQPIDPLDSPAIAAALQSASLADPQAGQSILDRRGIEITPCDQIPGARIEEFIAHVNLYYIRECTAVREEGGLGNITHDFITEAHSMLRSHVTALGGDALVGYDLNDLDIDVNASRNRVYILLRISGDIVRVAKPSVHPSSSLGAQHIANLSMSGLGVAQSWKNLVTSAPRSPAPHPAAS